jgi:S-adenosyl-L-methionine hydrolase (adenosine-forming)
LTFFADAPVGTPEASSYLLAAYAGWFVAGTVFLCFVDPGVGGARPALILEADGRLVCRPRQWPVRVGPAPCPRCAQLGHRLEARAPIGRFHGRDLFAPVAGMLARGEPPPGRPREVDEDRRTDWPDDLCDIVYIDHYGNAMTGLRAAMLPPNARLAVWDRMVERARTFSDLPTGAAFWYENSNGLAEIAVNRGRADRDLGLSVLLAQRRRWQRERRRLRSPSQPRRC